IGRNRSVRRQGLAAAISARRSFRVFRFSKTAVSPRRLRIKSPGIGGRLLSHGEKRQLEIAMCVATRPRVLLLDEPLAGMGAAETERMLDLLSGLKSGHAILLVEHDMDAVFRVSDRITVMVNGAVIASDVPAAVRADPEVQLAYLGEVDVH